MKRILSVLLCAVMLTACLPTPTQEAVKIQSEEYLDQVQEIKDASSASTATREPHAEASAMPSAAAEIIEPIEGAVAQIEIPQSIRTESFALTERLNLQYDCIVNVPADRFGIAQAEPRIFSSETLLAYMDLLLPKGTRYGTVGTTKSYYAALVQSYIEACRAADREPDEASIDRLARQAQNANAEAEEARFDPLAMRDYEACRVYVQNADKSYCSFVCKPGTAYLRYCFDESVGFLYREDLNAEEYRCESYQGYEQDFARDFPDPDTLRKTVLDTLAFFGLEDMSPAGLRQFIVYKETVPAAYGWTFVFVHGVNGIAQLYWSKDVEYGIGIPTLVSPFGAESASISIGSDGRLLCVELQNILQTPEVLMENVRLCEFDVLRSNVETFLKNRFSWPAQNNLPGSCVVIDSMTLYMACVNVKDHYELGRLIPMWFVEGRYLGTTPGGVNSIGETVPGRDFESPYAYCFSALDGSYIEPRTTREMLNN